MKPHYEDFVLDQLRQMPTVLDPNLVQDILDANKGFKIIAGRTLTTRDFYEGQARTDGFFCEFTPEESRAFLERCKSHHVANIEMEAAAFASLYHFLFLPPPLLLLRFYVIQ